MSRTLFVMLLFTIHPILCGKNLRIQGQNQPHSNVVNIPDSSGNNVKKYANGFHNPKPIYKDDHMLKGAHESSEPVSIKRLAMPLEVLSKPIHQKQVVITEHMGRNRSTRDQLTGHDKNYGHGSVEPKANPKTLVNKGINVNGKIIHDQMEGHFKKEIKSKDANTKIIEDGNIHIKGHQILKQNNEGITQPQMPPKNMTNTNSTKELTKVKSGAMDYFYNAQRLKLAEKLKNTPTVFENKIRYSRSPNYNNYYDLMISLSEFISITSAGYPIMNAAEEVYTAYETYISNLTIEGSKIDKKAMYIVSSLQYFEKLKISLTKLKELLSSTIKMIQYKGYENEFAKMIKVIATISDGLNSNGIFTKVSVKELMLDAALPVNTTVLRDHPNSEQVLLQKALIANFVVYIEKRKNKNYKRDVIILTAIKNRLYVSLYNYLVKTSRNMITLNTINDLVRVLANMLTTFTYVRKEKINKIIVEYVGSKDIYYNLLDRLGYLKNLIKDQKEASEIITACEYFISYLKQFKVEEDKAVYLYYQQVRSIGEDYILSYEYRLKIRRTRYEINPKFYKSKILNSLLRYISITEKFLSRRFYKELADIYDIIKIRALRFYQTAEVGLSQNASKDQEYLYSLIEYEKLKDGLYVFERILKKLEIELTNDKLFLKMKKYYQYLISATSQLKTNNDRLAEVINDDEPTDTKLRYIHLYFDNEPDVKSEPEIDRKDVRNDKSLNFDTNQVERRNASIPVIVQKTSGIHTINSFGFKKRSTDKIIQITTPHLKKNEKNPHKDNSIPENTNDSLKKSILVRRLYKIIYSLQTHINQLNNNNIRYNYIEFLSSSEDLLNQLNISFDRKTGTRKISISFSQQIILKLIGILEKIKINMSIMVEKADDLSFLEEHIYKLRQLREMLTNKGDNLIEDLDTEIDQISLINEQVTYSPIDDIKGVIIKLRKQSELYLQILYLLKSLKEFIETSKHKDLPLLLIGILEEIQKIMISEEATTKLVEVLDQLTPEISEIIEKIQSSHQKDIDEAIDDIEIISIDLNSLRDEVKRVGLKTFDFDGFDLAIEQLKMYKDNIKITNKSKKILNRGSQISHQDTFDNLNLEEKQHQTIVSNKNEDEIPIISIINEELQDVDEGLVPSINKDELYDEDEHPVVFSIKKLLQNEDESPITYNKKKLYQKEDKSLITFSNNNILQNEEENSIVSIMMKLLQNEDESPIVSNNKKLLQNEVENLITSINEKEFQNEDKNLITSNNKNLLHNVNESPKTFSNKNSLHNKNGNLITSKNKKLLHNQDEVPMISDNKKLMENEDKSQIISSKKDILHDVVKNPITSINENEFQIIAENPITSIDGNEFHDKKGYQITSIPEEELLNENESSISSINDKEFQDLNQSSMPQINEEKWEEEDESLIPSINKEELQNKDEISMTSTNKQTRQNENEIPITPIIKKKLHDEDENPMTSIIKENLQDRDESIEDSFDPVFDLQKSPTLNKHLGKSPSLNKEREIGSTSQDIININQPSQIQSIIDSMPFKSSIPILAENPNDNSSISEIDNTPSKDNKGPSKKKRYHQKMGDEDDKVNSPNKPKTESLSNYSDEEENPNYSPEIDIDVKSDVDLSDSLIQTGTYDNLGPMIEVESNLNVSPSGKKVNHVLVIIEVIRCNSCLDYFKNFSLYYQSN